MKNILKTIEFKLLKILLKRYSSTQLDQFERWQVATSFGAVYIQIDREGDGKEYINLD